MSKKILAIYFSQTGQLAEMVDNLCVPFLANGCSVEKVRVAPKEAYPFPWTANQFFAVMPDCVLSEPTQINDFELLEKEYDLIILGYQAWFLSPSIPFNSFFQNTQLQQALKNSPVITITGARNMWVNAYKKIKESFKKLGVNHVGNIAQSDRHLNLVSFVTIFHWMIHGKKDKYLNLFPKPGVSDKDIASNIDYGKIIVPHLLENNWEYLQQKLTKNGAVYLKFHLMFIEQKAGVLFRLWANFIAKRKKKTFWLAVFKYYLLIALYVMAPIVYVVDKIIFQPFFPKYVQTKMDSILKLN